MVGWLAPASSPVLAVVSTVHLSLLLLRQHRSVHSFASTTLLLPSLVLAGQPWVLSSAVWLVAGLALHLTWFAACEKLLPRPVPARAPAPTGPGPAAATHPVGAPTAALASRPAGGFLEQTVLAVHEETEEIRTFRLARPPGFSFAPGQFLTVRVQVDGAPLVRCYSISSAPEVPGYLEITVRRQGQVSSTLHATLRPGSQLLVKGPAGKFVYPADDDRPVVLLAGGVGVTPLMSMLRHAVVAEPRRPVTLVFSVRDATAVVYRRELEWIAERHQQARVAVAVSRGPRAVGQRAGRVDAAMLSDLVPDVRNSIFMICGPNPMMDAMRSALAALGVPAAQVRSEAFEAAAALARGDERETPIAAAATEARGLRLTLRRSGRTVPIARRATLLEAAEAAGCDIPSSCRAGVCLTCRTRLLAGTVHCDSDSLDETDRAAGFILPCVAWPNEDCVLEA